MALEDLLTKSQNRNKNQNNWRKTCADLPFSESHPSAGAPDKESRELANAPSPSGLLLSDPHHSD